MLDYAVQLERLDSRNEEVVRMLKSARDDTRRLEAEQKQRDDERRERTLRDLMHRPQYWPY